MPKFVIELTQTIIYDIEIKAETRKEAISIVDKMIEDGEDDWVEKDSSDYTIVEDNLPDWKGFGRAIMENWYEHCDIDAADRFEWAIKFGILRPIPGGFDPESHVDEYGEAERGDPWFELVDKRAT